jgi:hypothetical protein
MKKLIFATLISGFGMWIVSGFWHNLILPGLYEDTHATHEGIFLLLISYLILAGCMVYLYPLLFNGDTPIMRGLKLGVLIGVLWIFPYTLAMAGAHGTSIIYVFKNTVWHMVEQGIGGIIIALFHKKF